MTAADYRLAHGLSRRGLVAAGTRERIAQNAHERLESKPAFTQRRDPAKATAARLGQGSGISPAGMEAIRASTASRRGQQRLGAVVECEWCGARFCPLQAAKKRPVLLSLLCLEAQPVEVGETMMRPGPVLHRLGWLGPRAHGGPQFRIWLTHPMLRSFPTLGPCSQKSTAPSGPNGVR